MTDSNSTPLIGINNFVRRQTAESEFTHFDGTLEQVRDLTIEHFEKAQGSYHKEDGVRLVRVPAEGFFCGVVLLQEGDKLVGEYRARREGEEPRKTLRVVREEGKSACVTVDVVLYRRETLQAEGEACTGADWDIISINGRVTEGEQPIHPDTLIANHFGLDGGTPTKMTPEQFETGLRESVLYWKSIAILAPKG